MTYRVHAIADKLHHVLNQGKSARSASFVGCSLEENGILAVAGVPPVIDLSRYNLETLRKDEELILYRARSKDDGTQVLVLSLVAGYPKPESLTRLEHEYFLREELDPTWAARPIAIVRHWDRPVLVLEDPGGVPLDQLLSQPLDLALSLVLLLAFRPRSITCISAALSTRTSSRPMFW